MTSALLQEKGYISPVDVFIWTGYNPWGKRGGKRLRFSKSGAPQIEAAYATHFVKPKPKKSPENGENV